MAPCAACGGAHPVPLSRGAQTCIVIAHIIWCMLSAFLNYVCGMTFLCLLGAGVQHEQLEASNRMRRLVRTLAVRCEAGRHSISNAPLCGAIAGACLIGCLQP